jgi:hypothetical protein
VNPEPPQPDEEDPRSGPGQRPPAQSPTSADEPQPWRSPSGRPGNTPAAGQPDYGQTAPMPGYGQPGYGEPAPPAGYPGRPEPGYGAPASPAPGYSPAGSGPGYSQGAPPATYGQPGSPGGSGQPGDQPGSGWGGGQGANQPGYGQPGPQPGYGGQAEQPGYGQAGSQTGYGQAQSQPGYGQAGSQPGSGQTGQTGQQPGYSPRRRQQPGFYQAETQAAIRSPAGSPPESSQPGSPAGYSQAGPPPGYGQPGYGQPGSPAGHNQPGSPAGHNQPASPSGYGQPGYGQPGSPAGYNQAGPPPGYGEPGSPAGYGQPGYGEAGSPPGYGQPGYGQAGYGQAGYNTPGGQPGYGSAGAQAPYAYGAAQPGYAGGQNPTMGFPGGPAPAPRKRRRGLLIGIAAAIVVIVVVAVSLTLALGGGDSPTTMALRSGQAIGVADGIAYTGTLSGKPAALGVTRAGTVEGTYTDSGSPVSRVTIQGVTYLNAPVAFWTADGIAGTEAGQAGGHWAKAPTDAVSLSFDSLTPVQIARVLKHVGPNPDSVARTFDGKKVIVLTDASVSYYLTVSSPHRLIHVAGGSGADAYSLDVKPLTATTVKPVFTTLHSDVAALVGAADPGAIVDGGTPKFLDCSTATRCTVTSSVTVTDPTATGNFSTPPVLVKMTVGFAPNQNGKPFANCSTTVAVPSPAAVKPGCGVTGGAWTTWFNSHSGHFSVWADSAYRVTVNSASSVATLQTALSQEQGAS